MFHVSCSIDAVKESDYWGRKLRKQKETWRVERH